MKTTFITLLIRLLLYSLLFFTFAAFVRKMKADDTESTSKSGAEMQFNEKGKKSFQVEQKGNELYCSTQFFLGLI